MKNARFWALPIAALLNVHFVLAQELVGANENFPVLSAEAQVRNASIMAKRSKESFLFCFCEESCTGLRLEESLVAANLIHH